MTALGFILCLAIGYTYYVTTGTSEIHGYLSIYTSSYIITTGIAAIYCMKSKDRSINAAGRCIIGYAFVAPFVYYSPNALLWCASIDLIMACYFIGLGAKRFEIYAGLFFLLAVATSALSAGGLVPSHLDRPFMFIAFSQPDITAICGHAANVIIGFSAGDFGPKIRNHLRSRLVIGDFSLGLRFVLFSDIKDNSATEEGAK